MRFGFQDLVKKNHDGETVYNFRARFGDNVIQNKSRPSHIFSVCD